MISLKVFLLAIFQKYGKDDKMQKTNQSIGLNFY
jgi:hypothetical protein